MLTVRLRNRFMLTFLPLFLLAQTNPIPTPAPPPPLEVLQPQEVRPLPGKLDDVPVFNSNSPELVQTEGILLSTFPPSKKSTSAAHLNFPFQGRFDVFAHHIAKPPTPEDLRTLYLGIIVHNPGKQPVTVDILQAASYLSQPDAPFVPMPSVIENPLGTVYAGPGDRVSNDILREQRQADFPPQLTIPPGESRMLMNHPIPVKTLTPPLNGRSTLMRLRSNAKVYMASLAMYARQNPNKSERTPTLEEWQTLLNSGNLAQPRDRVPTSPEANKGQLIYGRVAGVAQGSQWKARVVERPGAVNLSIPQPGKAFSYSLSTVPRGTLGTERVQSAPMLVRYPDTAYMAHGNYGVHYSLTLPLMNDTNDSQTVTLAIQTPIKQDRLQGGLRFLEPPPQQVFFRGTVQIQYTDDRGLPQIRYVHLVQRRGQQGEPLITLKMLPGDRRLVKVDFIYPPDATPPQVLTVRTLEKTS